jgi:hypothetical protein
MGRARCPVPPLFFLAQLLPSQVLHVGIGPKPDVIGEVPADVIGIVVDDDIVRIPEPAVTETNVVGSHGEEEASEPEAAGTSASEMPHMAATEATAEAAMLPGMIHVVMNVAAAGIVTDPFSTVVDVRSVGMPSPVVEVAVFLGCMRGGYSGRTVPGNIFTPSADLWPATASMMLS